MRTKPLRWTIVTSAPKGEAGEQWGDTWFARDLAEALQDLGQDAHVVARTGANAPAREHDDVILVLRGLRRVVPQRRPGQIWLLWVISHPELIESGELAEFDAVFAASEHWKPTTAITPLLQATNPRRFHPMNTAAGEEVLFVGSTRGEFRPMVRDAIDAGLPIGVYGVGWETYIDPAFIRGTFLPNVDLPQAYASAGVVLNDHWVEMAESGFLSNRLFDAVAAGAHVVSDPVLGLTDVFDDAVSIASSAAELRAVIENPPTRDRKADAERIAAEHSFTARARVLIESVEALRR